LVHRLMEFMLHGSPLVERPRLGSDFIMEGFEMTLPAMVSERYRTAFRMGAVKTGKMVGEHMKEAGLEGDEAAQRLVQFLEHCNVGKVKLGETIRIENNCESRMTQLMTTKLDEPLCFFTTGFLNGFFSAIKDQHVKETKCIAVGDPYCEWEFR
jgi:predicted hydrocarbon binding protein